MKKLLYPLFYFVHCLIVAIFCLGCDSGGGGDDEENTSAAITTNAPAPAPSAEQLGSGTRTVVGGGPAIQIGPFTAPAAGAITANITWNEGGQLIAMFKKEGSAVNYGWVNGDSPLHSTVEPVAAGENCLLFLVNSGVGNKVADFIVTYVP